MAAITDFGWRESEFLVNALQSTFTIHAYVPRWDLGGSATRDFAVTSGLRNDLLEQTAADGSSCLTQYENFRNAYLNSAEKRE